MPEPMEAPQGQEQKLVFKTEEDRQKALDEIPVDLPDGITDIDAWRTEMDAKQDAIEQATVDPNYTGQPTDGARQPNQDQPQPQADQPPAPAPDQGDWYRPEDWTFSHQGQQVTIGRDEIPVEMQQKNISSAKDLMYDYINTHRYAESKAQEYQKSLSRMQEQMNEQNKRIEEYENKLKAADKKDEAPPKPAENIPSNDEITQTENELNQMFDQIAKLEEEDPDEANALTRKALRIQTKLTAMKDKANSARWQSVEQEREQLKKTAEQQKEEAARAERERRQQEEREQRKSEMVKSIEGFSNQSDDLKLSKPFAQVEQEYSDWAADVAATYFDTPANQLRVDQIEQAVQHFLNRTPSLMDKLSKQGKLNRAPADLRKYLITTELYLMTQGQEFDPVSGTFVQHDWKLPDMDTAYDRWKKKKGLKYQDEVNAANKAEEELLKVMNPTGVAEEIPANQGAQQQRDMSKMSLPQAQTALGDLEKRASMNGYGNLEEWIENLRRTDPGNKDVELYDRADEALMSEFNKA